MPACPYCRVCREKPLKTETVATLPGDLGLIPIAEALKSATSRTGGKPNVIARGPEPCSPGISRARSRIGPGCLATVSKLGGLLKDRPGGFGPRGSCRVGPASHIRLAISRANWPVFPGESRCLQPLAADFVRLLRQALYSGRRAAPGGNARTRAGEEPARPRREHARITALSVPGGKRPACSRIQDSISRSGLRSNTSPTKKPRRTSTAAVQIYVAAQRIAEQNPGQPIDAGPKRPRQPTARGTRSRAFSLIIRAGGDLKFDLTRCPPPFRHFADRTAEPIDRLPRRARPDVGLSRPRAVTAADGVPQEVERLFRQAAEPRLGLVDRQPQPERITWMVLRFTVAVNRYEFRPFSLNGQQPPR